VKLYTDETAPNPRRVQIFIAEKGLEIPREFVSLREGAHMHPDFVALNPDRVVPALVLDDGTVISESVAICRYLDAAHPERPLCGATPREVGLVSMWVRRLELQLYQPVQDAYRNSRPAFAGRALPGSRGEVPQIADLVPRAQQCFGRMSKKLDQRLSGRDFILGEKLSLADIIAYTTLAFAIRTKMRGAPEAIALPSIGPWYRALALRPAFTA
jgi:glutathione S-transferase